MKLYAGFLVWWFAMLFIACHADILNDDPLHGGPCANGDQLAHLCKDRTTCCPAGYLCALDGKGCEIDESQIGPGHVSLARDAGRE
jgi:hypothetical protein